jgi:hypothetical protein
MLINNDSDNGTRYKRWRGRVDISILGFYVNFCGTYLSVLSPSFFFLNFSLPQITPTAGASHASPVSGTLSLFAQIVSPKPCQTRSASLPEYVHRDREAHWRGLLAGAHNSAGGGMEESKKGESRMVGISPWRGSRHHMRRGGTGNFTWTTMSSGRRGKIRSRLAGTLRFLQRQQREWRGGSPRHIIGAGDACICGEWWHRRRSSFSFFSN